MVTRQNKFDIVLSLLKEDSTFSSISEYLKIIIATEITRGLSHYLSFNKAYKYINEFCLYTEARPFIISRGSRNSKFIIAITNITKEHIRLLINIHTSYTYYLNLEKDDLLENPDY